MDTRAGSICRPWRPRSLTKILFEPNLAGVDALQRTPASCEQWFKLLNVYLHGSSLMLLGSRLPLGRCPPED